MSHAETFKSSHFGTLTIDTDTVITFPQGIIQLEGFENCTRYSLLHDEDSDKVLRYLQSLDNPDLFFSLIDPVLLHVKYEISLNDEEAETLGLESKEDEVVIMLMVYRPLNIDGETVTQQEEIKAQTQSPLIINPVKRLGLQKVGLSSRLIFTNVD